MNKLMLGCAIAALAASGAYAQSTGSVDFDNTIVVTGSTTNKGVAGVVAPDTSKAKAVLTQEFITHQVPGQSIDSIINMLPGVSFNNNDPFGSAGGKLFIRGFDNSRISQTFDGMPTNDTGNYALYSSQLLDPELVDQVNVNLGSTDVDSPTAAATGSTVNYRSRNPTDDFHVRIQGSAGDYSYFRMFGVVDTGVFTPWGTKAWLAASHSENNNVFNHFGKIDKDQYNGKIYQPIGSSGDFISLAGHYSKSRNNFFGSVPLRVDTTQSPTVLTSRIVGPDSSNRFPLTKDERFYTIARCNVDTPQAGVADAPNLCGSFFDERYNPSNTGNVRLNSRFTLADGLVLTVDPSYQYTLANGGGTATASEKLGDVNPSSTITTLFPGYIGSTPFAGVDLNGDGDLLDTVRVAAPSTTQTHRYSVIASLRYDISDTQTVRVAYSFDRGRHRQTGEIGALKLNGAAADYFTRDNPISDSSGQILQKRDRLSYAILNQFSGEYRGEFFDNRLTVNLGLRAPFFKRELNNNCFTTAATGTLACFNENTAANAAYAAANPTFSPPQRRVFKYDKLLPNAGLVFDIAPKISAFANYSKGLQVPSTDNLYNAFFFALNTPQAKPTPETTDNFDLGARYSSSKVQAQLSAWYTLYDNRLASAYDIELDRTVYRNLGKVTKYGIDGSIAYSPIPEVSLYAFGSYLKSKIKDDVALSATTFALTSGKRESGAPIYTLGARAEGRLGPVTLGAQAKRTGSRYINDQNLPVQQCRVSLVNSVCPAGNAYQVYGAKAQGYTLVDLDVRVSLEGLGLNKETYFQFNVTNLFDKLYVGGFDGTLVTTSITNAQIGAPRAFIGTLVIGL